MEGSGGAGASHDNQPNVVINVSQSTPSPLSPRLVHLRPPSPLTPEAMRRIKLLTVQEQSSVDPSKLSPLSPSPSITSSITSDLGSSPRSSISLRTSSSSFTWSTYRENKKSSSDLTDVDSDLCKDLFSPNITLSPAPFSPFSDQPTFSEPTSTPNLQRLRFTFDPKSPSFLPLTPSRSSHFLLPPPPTYGFSRERSRSDSDTVVFESSDEDLSQAKKGRAEASAQEHKHKKRLLRKYEEEKVGLGLDSLADLGAASIVDDEPYEKPSAPKSSRHSLSLSGLKSINLPTVQHSSTFAPGPRSLYRCSSSQSDYGSSSGQSQFLDSSCSSSPNPQSTTPYESVRLPLMRFEERNDLPANQANFDLWLKSQLLAVNRLWYPMATGAGPSVPVCCASRDLPLIGPHYSHLPKPPTVSVNTSPLRHPTLVHSFHRPSPIYPPPVFRTPFQYRPLQTHLTPPEPPLAFGRRSRSESDVSYECVHCGQSFNLRDRLAKHVASRHKDQSQSASNEAVLKSHKCTVCQKYFGRSDMLTRHMRLHTGIRPYVCHTCGQVFSRSDHLSTHQRTHTGEKPYQCPVCSYAASRRDMITRHMRTHSRSTSGSDEATTSQGYHDLGREKALDQTISGDSSDQWQLLTPKISPDSESGRRSGSSTSTILCLEEETSSGGEIKNESSSDETTNKRS